MGMEIRKDFQVRPSYESSANQTNQAKPAAEKTSGSNTENEASKVNGTSVYGVTAQQKMPSLYEENQSKIVLEQEMDKLIKQLMPDLGVKFRVHDSGQIITTVTNNTTNEVVREFPAEKILDIVYNMCQRLGIVTNKKI